MIRTVVHKLFNIHKLCAEIIIKHRSMIDKHNTKKEIHKGVSKSLNWSYEIISLYLMSSSYIYISRYVVLNRNGFIRYGDSSLFPAMSLVNMRKFG